MHSGIYHYGITAMNISLFSARVKQVNHPECSRTNVIDLTCYYYETAHPVMGFHSLK